MLPETNTKEAVKIAERIRKSIAEIDKFFIIKNTISIGVAELVKNDSKESFLKRADDALYKAKDKGRNRVEKLG